MAADRLALAAPALAARGVALVLDQPLGQERRGWLRDHLAPLPAGLRARVVTVARRSVRDGATWDEAWSDELRELMRLLGRGDGERRCVVGEFAAVADALDDGATLAVVLDDPASTAPGPAWALRRARGPALVLPSSKLRSPGEPPRALLVARDAAEVRRLAAWVDLLAPGVEVALQGVVAPTSESPTRVLSELQALEAALHGAAAALSRVGRVTSTSLVTDADAEDAASTLVVRVARRGLLRRLLPGPDGRARRRRPRPRLLLPPAGG